VVRQVVTDGSGGTAQMVECWASNQIFWNLGLTPNDIAHCMSLRNTPNAIWGPSSLPIVVDQLDKDCKQDRSALEWYDKQRA